MLNTEPVKEKLFSTDFTLVSIVGLLIRFSMFIKITLQPLYLLELYSSKTIAGSAMTVFTVASLVLRPFSGKIIEKYGRKTVFSAGTILFAVTTVPFGFVHNLPLLYFFQILCGFGFSFQSVANTTMVTDIVPQQRLLEGLGYFGLTATLAQALGPATALFVSDNLGFSIRFLFTGIIAFVSVLVAFFVSYEKDLNHGKPSEAQSCAEEPEEIKDLLGRLIEKKAAYASLFVGVLSFVSSSISTFLIPYARFVGIAGIGFYYTSRAFGVAFSRLFAGKVSERVSKYKLLGAGLFTVFLCVSAINFVRNIYVLIPVAFIFGAGFGLSHLLLNVGAVVHTTKKERAGANATYYLAMDAGIGIGALSWGVIGDVLGLENIFKGSGLIALLIFIAYIITSRNRKVF